MQQTLKNTRPTSQSLSFIANSQPDSFCASPEILDSLQCGIFIVTREAQLLYTNAKAEELCASLFKSELELSNLIRDICDRWNNRFSDKPLIIEYLGREQQIIRARVQSCPQLTKAAHTASILILLKDLNQQFESELSIECQKYMLTKREVEVWRLLRQGYTYEAAAKALGLSINTIKTHAKHIHSKRLNYEYIRPKIWFSR